MFLISYRNLELMLQHHGVRVGHTTVYRWIQAYAPEMERRIGPRLRPNNSSWRVVETYMWVKGRWTYLSRQEDNRESQCSSHAPRFLARQFGPLCQCDSEYTCCGGPTLDRHESVWHADKIAYIASNSLRPLCFVENA